MDASRRERWLWTLSAVYLGALYASSYAVRLVLDALLARGLLGATVATLLGGGALAAAAFLLRRRPGRAQLGFLAAAGALYVAVVLQLELPQERLHILEYGLLGVLVDTALRVGVERRGGPWRVGGLPLAPAPLAVLLTAAAGWLDEGIQHLVPNRYYDLRDVGFNAFAGALAVALAALWRRLPPPPPRARAAAGKGVPENAG